MQITPANEEEQMVILEALLTAAYGLEEDAALDDRRGRRTSAEHNRRDALTLRKWRDEVDDMDFSESRG